MNPAALKCNDLLRNIPGQTLSEMSKKHRILCLIVLIYDYILFFVAKITNLGGGCVPSCLPHN